MGLGWQGVKGSQGGVNRCLGVYRTIGVEVEV